jgi:hypothetical protein
MTTTDLAELNWAGMWSFLHKHYGTDAFARALVELVDGGRYGDCLSKQKQASAIKELRSLGLDAVADIVEQTLPQIWDLPHPYQDKIWEGGIGSLSREQLILKHHKEMAALKAAHEAKHSRPGTTVDNTPA